MSNSTTPLISIVMPVYNNEKYFPMAVESVLSQKLENDSAIELIIVDDGSTDMTGQIADELSAKDARIKVIHQNNQWVYASMNNGIRAASGEYVYILNSDDKLADGAITLLIKKIAEYDHPDVIWTKIKWYYVDENQKVISSVDFDTKTDFYCKNQEEVHINWVYLEECNFTTANLYKRELMVSHPFRNDVYGADILFNYDIADEIQTMTALGDVIYLHMIYQQPERNVSKGKYYPYMHEMFNEIFQKAKQIYEKWNISENVYMPLVADRRIKQVTDEVIALSYPTCHLNLREKMLEIYHKVANAQMRDIAIKVGREREYESRILNGTAKVLDGQSLDEDLKFIEKLVAGLPKVYTENVDWSRIDRAEMLEAAGDPLNTDKIGKIYYTQDW